MTVIQGLPEDIDIKLRISRIPVGTYERMRLAKFEKQNGNTEAVNAIADMLNGKIGKPLVLLIGDPGLGKTHLALAVGWERVLAGKSVVYWQLSELLDALRDGYRHEDWRDNSADSYSAIMGYAKACHTLILDDMGYQKDTEWSAEKLDSLVDSRYINGKETIITANTAKIPDRIFDRCKDGRIVMLKGKSYRGSKGAKYGRE